MQIYVDIFDVFNFFNMHKIKLSIGNEINNKGIYILLIIKLYLNNYKSGKKINKNKSNNRKNPIFD